MWIEEHLRRSMFATSQLSRYRLSSGRKRQTFLEEFRGYKLREQVRGHGKKGKLVEDKVESQKIQTHLTLE